MFPTAPPTLGAYPIQLTGKNITSINALEFLKNIENDKRVTVVAAKALENKQLIADFKKIFPDKKIIMKEDKSLILGVKIINKDTIFDFNLKNTLENIVEHITYG